MAVKLVKSTAKEQQLKLVSVRDDAIDWYATYPEMGPDVKSKKKRYEKERDVTVLRWEEGKKPTLFVFHHPKRAEIARRMRITYTRTLSDSAKAEIFTEIFNEAFIGTQEGFEGKMDAAPRIDDKITEDYYQALEDAGVLTEIAGAFLAVVNRQGDDVDTTKKK